MDNNSKAIAVLCAHTGKKGGVKPLSTGEWDTVATMLLDHGMQPKDLIAPDGLESFRKTGAPENLVTHVSDLMDHTGSITFALNDIVNRGIKIITRSDETYPRMLKRKLGHRCPPVFFAAGFPELLEHPSIGFAGSRNIDEEDRHFTRELAGRAAERGYTVVSGGARGVDSESAAAACENGGNVIEFLSGSMNRKMKDPEVLRAVQDGRLLLLSESAPNAGFQVSTAMMRNKYIYAQALGVVVVKSDFNRGGTWSGATEDLRNGWTPVFCRNLETSRGNLEIINRGAIPIDEHWDPDDVRKFQTRTEKKTGTVNKAMEVRQISMFDTITAE